MEELAPLEALLRKVRGWTMDEYDVNHCMSIARKVYEVYEPLVKLDRKVSPRKQDVLYYKEWALRKLHYLFVCDYPMIKMMEIIQSNETNNTRPLDGREE